MFRTMVIVLALVTATYTRADEPKNSMVDVIVTSGDVTMAGRGVVVASDLVLTADHVIEHNGAYHIPKIRFFDRTERLAAAIVKRWADRDLALIRVAVPEIVAPIPISDAEPSESWSFDYDGNVQKYRYCIVNRGSNYFDYTPRAGESGGPVFDASNRLIGIVSGGNFWLENRPNFTWPLRAGRVDVIREYVK